MMVKKVAWITPLELIAAVVVGVFCGIVALESFGAEVDIKRTGYWEVLDEGGAVLSSHSEIHVAFEKASNLALQSPGKQIYINPPIFSAVAQDTGCPAIPVCPECPPVKVCPEQECPECPQIPEPPPPPVLEDVTLQWEAPTARENGNTISGVDPDALDFYTIEWKTGSSSSYTKTVQAPATEYTFEGLSQGIWDFRVNVTDKTGSDCTPTEDIICPGPLTSNWSDWVSANIGGVEEPCTSEKPINFVCERFDVGVQCTWAPQCGSMELEQYDSNYVGDGNGWNPYITVLDGEGGCFLIPDADLMPANSDHNAGYRARANLLGVTSSWSSEQWIDRVHRGDPADLMCQ